MTTESLAEVLEHAFDACRSLDVPLGVRLAAFADAVRRASPTFADAVDRLVARLKMGKAGMTAPALGDPMLGFVLPDDRSELVSLDQLLEKGPAAISFHRGYWCPYCRMNANALEEAQRQVATSGGQIVAITPDTQKFASDLKQQAGATFSVLTDVDNGYAMSLDLAIWVGDEMRKMMVDSGFDPSVSQGNENWMLPIPATFVVNTRGIITARFVDPDYRKRMDIDELVRAVESAG